MKVSVIMPSFNVGKYIKECMESVRNQSLHDMEMICIDAGSTDGTREILESYAKIDRRIRLLNSDVKSYGRQVNMGIDLAQGKYIAVLETDDYIEREMYQTLVEIAEAAKADFVKADYDSFFCLEDGSYFFQRYHLFGGLEHGYNRILEHSQMSCLYAIDHNLWKGIYKKDFLDAHHIRLNETLGAAYQDIGFVIQTLAKAKRVVYTDRSFYRYRIDRQTASFYDPRCLTYAQGELSWILKSGILDGMDDIHLHEIRKRFFMIFLAEYEKSLSCHGYRANDQDIKDSYQWFQENLGTWMKEGLLSEEDFSENIWKKLQQAFFHNYVFAENCKKTALEEEMFYETIKNADEFVIFGMGVIGRTFFANCMRKGIVPAALTDNDPKIWGKVWNGHKLLSTTECFRTYHEALYVIANRKGKYEIKEQLLKQGVPGSQIIFYERKG